MLDWTRGLFRPKTNLLLGLCYCSLQSSFEPLLLVLLLFFHLLFTQPVVGKEDLIRSSIAYKSKASTFVLFGKELSTCKIPIMMALEYSGNGKTCHFTISEKYLFPVWSEAGPRLSPLHPTEALCTTATLASGHLPGLPVKFL